MTKTYNLLVFSFFLFCFSGPACAYEADDLGGTVQAEVDGEIVYFPTLKTDITANIQGDLATVEIRQIFSNPLDVPLNARYLFPMNKDSAVYAMRMEVGDEIVEAQIQEIQEAKKTFEKAKKEGKAASLLTQHRPNMFTQKIANLMPGLPITVTLKYTQSVPKVEGDYELVLPLIVGPRYQSGNAGEPPVIMDDGVAIGQAEVSASDPFGKWEIEELPPYPPVAGLNLPQHIEEDRVSIKVKINAAMPVLAVYSDTHALEVTGDEHMKDVSLAAGRVIDNSDFVLRYQLSGRDTQAGFLSSSTEKGGFFSLLIEPPAAPQEEQITPREMVFVLDTSGSMSGLPIAASKTFMRHALENLRPTDYFRIIQFNNNAQEYMSSPVSASPRHIQDGLTYVDGLYASGGTEMHTAITQAFRVAPEPGTLRIVVFLTDGYIGSEASVLQQINTNIGEARIYAFGMGTSVNRFLLSEMGRAGRGFARFLDPTENADDVARQLATRLESPVLTDINIDWDDMNVSDITPAIIPDLFAGDSIRIQGQFHDTGTHTVRVKGKVKGHAATMPLQITLPSAKSSERAEMEQESIPLIWARSRIADYMRQINMPARLREDDLTDDKLKQKVVRLGLDFSLMTKWTSFVAVSKKVVNTNPEKNKNTQVPLSMVKGVSHLAYGGGSTPEPATMGGLMVLGLMGAAALRRRRRV